MRGIWKRSSFGLPLLTLTTLLLAGAAGAQQVTLPLEKFEALRARANPGAETQPAPPAPYALELADYAVKVSRESGTSRPSIRTSERRVTVAFESRFFKLNRTPPGTFSRLPRVYICLRIKPGIFMDGSPSVVRRGKCIAGGGRVREG